MSKKKANYYASDSNELSEILKWANSKITSKSWKVKQIFVVLVRLSAVQGFTRTHRYLCFTQARYHLILLSQESLEPNRSKRPRNLCPRDFLAGPSAVGGWNPGGRYRRQQIRTNTIPWEATKKRFGSKLGSSCGFCERRPAVRASHSGWVGGQSQSFTHITAHRGTVQLFDKIVGLQRWSSRALLFTAHRCLQLDTGRHWDKMSGRVFLRCQVVGSQAASVEFKIQKKLSKLANTLLKYKIKRSNYKTLPKLCLLHFPCVW